MTNYRFTFGDFDSDDWAIPDYGGMIVTNIPPIRFPAKRTSTVAIRDGENIVETGLEAYNLPITVAFTKDFISIDQAQSSLVGELMRRGEDWLALSNSTFKVRARVIDAVTFEKNLKFRQAVITFRCQPYHYLDLTPVTGTSSIELANYGNVTAYPVIKFTGTSLTPPAEGYFSVHRIEKVYDGGEGGAVIKQTEKDIARIYSPLTKFTLDGITGRAYSTEIAANLIYVGDLPDVPPNLVDGQATTVTYSITCQNPEAITASLATFYERWQ